MSKPTSSKKQKKISSPSESSNLETDNEDKHADTEEKEVNNGDETPSQDSNVEEQVEEDEEL